MGNKYDCTPEEYASRAANPDSMGGHGQPIGRDTEEPQERDSNHPQGTNERAGLPSARSTRPNDSDD